MYVIPVGLLGFASSHLGCMLYSTASFGVSVSHRYHSACYRGTLPILVLQRQHCYFKCEILIIYFSHMDNYQGMVERRSEKASHYGQEKGYFEIH